mgnify:CR=1 FL=1
MMLQGLQQTVAGANTLIASTDTLLAKIEPYVSTHSVTAEDYINAIETVREIISGSNRLVLAADQTGMPLLSTMVDQFNRAAEERVDHIVSQLLILITVTGGIGLVLVIVHGRLKRKQP